MVCRSQDRWALSRGVPAPYDAKPRQFPWPAPGRLTASAGESRSPRRLVRRDNASGPKPKPRAAVDDQVSRESSLAPARRRPPVDAVGILAAVMRSGGSTATSEIRHDSGCFWGLGTKISIWQCPGAGRRRAKPVHPRRARADEEDQQDDPADDGDHRNEHPPPGAIGIVQSTNPDREIRQEECEAGDPGEHTEIGRRIDPIQGRSPHRALAPQARRES